MVKGTGQEVRTSATHPIQVNWLPADAADGVGLTFAPGKKGSSIYGYRWDRDLAADLQTLAREHRVQTLVTLMEDHELASSRIPGLIASTEHHGIASVHFPIPDLGVPDDASEVDVLLDGIEARLASGERVVIHCLGGIGRTGTIATCLLVRRGMTVADATRVVQDTRCKGFPESAAQKRFVAEYGRRVEKRRPSALLDRRGSATAQTTGRSSAPTPGAATLRDSSARGDKGLPWSVLGTSERARQHGGVALSRDQVCELLGAIEQQVSAAPAECFSLDLDGTATLHVKSRSYHAGQFEVPTLATLEQRVLATPPATRGRIRMSILRGTDPLTDIGTLQATAPAGTLFQVASQFNCLEAPGDRLVAIRKYPHDPTQGPRASVSAFPGTFLRHYFAPRDTGERFVQTDQDTINLIADALSPKVARVKSGYLTTDLITDTSALATALEEKFGQLRVGVHDDVEVVLGTNWGGAVANAPNQRIAQVFTSTIALGGYSHDDGSHALATVRGQLLRAAYFGTLLAAIALRKPTVVLTLIGGGAFGNPHRSILDAIHWAIAEAEPHVHGVLDVVVNVRSDAVDVADLERATYSGGEVIEITEKEIRLRR